MTDDLQPVTVDVSSPAPDPIDSLSTKRERTPGERGLKALLEKERAERRQVAQQSDTAQRGCHGSTARDAERFGQFVERLR
jgi:hypothetical protein